MKRVLLTSLSILVLSTTQAIANSASNASANTSESNRPRATNTSGQSSVVTPEADAMQMPKENLSRSKAPDSYPAYCPSLPSRVTEKDWLYREALHNCLYGT